MRRIMATTALATLMALPAAAQQVQAPATEMTFEVPTEIEGGGWTSIDVDTQDLEGEAVWSSVTNERIGDVDGVFADGNGNRFVKASIGGFWDLGDKDVLFPMDQVGIFTNTEDDDVRVYVEATEEQLEAYPAYDG